MNFERVLVIGAGTMGHGIAHVAALAGYEAQLYDVDADAVFWGMGVRNVPFSWPGCPMVPP